MPKSIPCDLLASVGGTYDQTRTTIQGRVATQTVNSQPVLMTRKNNWLDIAADTANAVTSLGPFVMTSNNRIFAFGPESGGITPLVLYNFNATTGTATYVGRLNFLLPDFAVTTHTYRVTGAIDNGVSGWKIILSTTGTVAINGGVFLINNLALTDFVPVGFPTIPFASGTNQKAVYSLQDPTAIGVGHLLTSAVGGDIDGNDLWVHNGVAGLHQYWRFDLSVAPVYTTQTFTVTIASPGVVTAAGHGFANNDPVALYTTGALPTGLNTTGVFFVRNATANTFELSATSGGASINTTGTQTGVHSVGRAYGISSSNFVYRTGNLPVLSGALLASDSENIGTPTSVPANPSLNGQKCVAFGTATNLYMGLLSELTSGATTWPSLSTSNVLGAVNETTAPTPTFLQYSYVLDRFVFITNTSLFYTKPLQNNILTHRFGCLNTDFYETSVPVSPEFGFAGIVGMDVYDGWVVIAGTTAGQRGLLTYDFKSHETWDFSYVVSKVLTLPSTTIRSIAPLIERLNPNSNPEFGCFYRTSGFGTVSGGWLPLTLRNRINLGVANQIQFKITWRTARPFTTNPGGLLELLLELLDNNETSSNWTGNNDQTTGGSPSRAAFRLLKTYTSVVPQLFFRAYDDAGALVVNHDTVANAANFQYSTDNGTSWNPVGTIPNTVGTLLRYNFASPPGVQVTVSLREI